MEVDQIDLMTPTQKVAALLIALGPTTSAEIMKQITDDEVLSQVTLDIASLNKVPVDVLNAVLKEFYSIFLASDYLMSGGMDYAKMLLKKAYGNEQADRILDKLVTLLSANPFQFFNVADPSQLATSFQNENPQLIALILAYLKPEVSAQVLNALPPDIQAPVSLRIAEMSSTNPEVLADIEKIVESKFSSIVVQDVSKAGGIQTLANILNRADRSTEKNVIEMLKDDNPELVEDVKALMFVFEDIVNLEDKAIQRVLREVDTKDLAVSLKGINDSVRDKIFKNMSERAQDMLREDIEYMGPVRARTVQDAQSKIVSTIRALEAAGEIVLFRGEDELIE